MNKYSIPAVGTDIPFTKGDAHLSTDRRTYICRIQYDEKTQQWVVVKPEVQRGLLVFLNDAPDANTTHIRISAIQSTGKGAWADPFDFSLTKYGFYD